MKNIYEFEFKGEKDWVTADTKKEAVRFYSDEIGDPFNELNKKCRRLTKKEAQDGFIVDTDDWYDEIPEHENEDDFENGYRIKCSMREEADDHTWPLIIATTVF